MIETNEDWAAIILGEGDVFMARCDERPHGGSRNYVWLSQQEPGAIGECDETGRPPPLKDGDTPPAKGAIFIEASKPESLDMLIDLLTEYRDDLRKAGR